jgi:hypothetical protein
MGAATTRAVRSTAMSPLRLPRWTALLVLPLLAGALLLMHGLDAGASTSGLPAAAAAAPTHAHHGETPAEHHDAGCDGCEIGHVMAACVAIVATVVGLRLARRAMGPRVATRAAAAPGLVRAARELLRPPEPAWVRLAVMRC